MSKNTRVVIVSPFRGDEMKNRRYLIACMRDCIQRGESPFAGHLIYPLVLDDNLPSEREAGMAAGRDWLEKADVVAVYMDFGYSEGMRADVAHANKHKIKVEERNLSRMVLEKIK